MLDPVVKARRPDLNENTIQEARKYVSTPIYRLLNCNLLGFQFIKCENDLRGIWSARSRKLLFAYAMQKQMPSDSKDERELVIRALTAGDAYGIVCNIFMPDDATDHDVKWFWSFVVSSEISEDLANTYECPVRFPLGLMGITCKLHPKASEKFKSPKHRRPFPTSTICCRHIFAAAKSTAATNSLGTNTKKTKLKKE
jgi:hypothetical protein